MNISSPSSSPSVTARPLSNRTAMLLAIISLLLAACSGSGDDVADTPSATTTTESESAAALPTPVTATVAESGDSEASNQGELGSDSAVEAATPTTPAGDSSSNSGGPECVTGTYVVPTDQMDLWYSTFLPNAGAGDVTFDLAPASTGTMTFGADGSLEQALTVVGEMNVAGTGASVDMNGVVTGTWSASEGNITLLRTDSVLDGSVSVSGVTMPFSEFSDLPTQFPETNTTYRCTAEYLDLDWPTETAAGPVTIRLNRT